MRLLQQLLFWRVEPHRQGHGPREPSLCIGCQMPGSTRRAREQVRDGLSKQWQQGAIREMLTPSRCQPDNIPRTRPLTMLLYGFTELIYIFSIYIYIASYE